MSKPHHWDGIVKHVQATSLGWYSAAGLRSERRVEVASGLFLPSFFLCTCRKIILHSTLPFLALIWSPPSTGHLSGDIAMVNMVLTCTERHMFGHVRVGACECIMYMYVCMHVHVCVSPCILSCGVSELRAPSATEVPGQGRVECNLRWCHELSMYRSLYCFEQHTQP